VELGDFEDLILRKDKDKEEEDSLVNMEER